MMKRGLRVTLQQSWVPGTFGICVIVFVCWGNAWSSEREDLGRQIGGVFTFGSPRCGDQRFAALFSEAFDGRAFRYVNPRSST
jgi:hypothetical protein